MESSDKKKQLSRWFSEDELVELSNLANKAETVKVDHIYPNLYSQACYSMQSLARLKDEIMQLVEDGTFGPLDEAADILVKSIYDSLIADLDPFNDSSDFDTRRLLKDFANETYTKIELAKTLRSICDNFDSIRHLQDRINLAKHGVLI